MSDQQQAVESSQRTRGKGFPLIPLGEARDYVAEAAKYGMSHHLDAFAGYMGHSKASGGAFNNKIAAVRDWGLITRSGQQVSLTALGQRLALPTDPAEEARDLREAFSASKIFQEAYERNAKGTPLSEEAFGNSAVLNLGIASGGRDKFVRSFVKSAALVGLAEVRGDKTFVLKAASDEPAGDADADAGASDEAPNDRATPPGVPAPEREQVPLPSGLRPAFRQSWEFEGGQLEISLALSSPLPREAYAHIGVAMAELIGILEDDSRPEAG